MLFRTRRIVIGCLGLLAMLIIVSCSTEPVTKSSAPTSENATSSGVDWTDAEKYFGEYATVCGPVRGTNYASSSNGSPTFLNIGKDYPSDDRFVVLIWGENRNNFSFSPENYYLGKTICARGEVEMYDGIYQIEVRSPSMIDIQ